jgi:hypothetical protein
MNTRRSGEFFVTDAGNVVQVKSNADILLKYF